MIMENKDFLGHGFPRGIEAIGLVKLLRDKNFGKGETWKVNENDPSESIKLAPGLSETIYLVKADQDGCDVFAPGRAVTHYSWEALDSAEAWYW